MPSVASSTIEMTWAPESRLATIRFERETDATGKDGAVLVGALAQWIGAADEPFGLLGDGRGLRSLDAEYRSAWSAFFRRHRRRSFVAFFHMGPIVRVAAEMFRIGTGLQLKAFAGEEEARVWLRVKGIAA